MHARSAQTNHLLLGSLTDEIRLQDLSNETLQDQGIKALDARLTALEHSPLWNRDELAWLGCLDEQGVVTSPTPRVDAQLFSVLLKSQLRPEEARIDLQILKNSSFRVEGSDLYFNLQGNHFWPSTGDQLLGILLDLQFDRETATQKYLNFRSSETCDSETGEWLEYCGAELVQHAHYKHSDDFKSRADAQLGRKGSELLQLRQLAIEFRLEIEHTTRALDSLYESDSYDSETKRWRRVGGSIPPDGTYSYQTSDQLWEIYALISSNPVLAQEKFDLLKESEFYNKETAYWHESLHDNPDQHNFYCHSNTQLFGLLVETELYRLSNLSRQSENMTPRPDLRDF